MPDTVPAVDSQNAAMTPPQGIETSTNDPAQDTNGQGQQPTQLVLDEDFLKRLDAIDPAALPQSFAEKYVPKAEFTRKTQALAEDRKKFEGEKQAMFELARRAIADRPTAPTGPTAEEIKLKELSELAAAGDSNAQMQMAEILAERKVAPLRTQVTLQNAAQAARSNPMAGPAVVEHWNEIVQTIQNDPVIAQLATANNYAAADRVMVALGLEHMVRDLAPKYEAQAKEIEMLKGRLAGYERERAAGLPSSTTRAGTTAGRPAASEPRTIEEVDLRRAWLDAGGTEDTFR